MTTTAYDMPWMYAWPAMRSRRRIAVRVAKLVATLVALVPTVAFAAMLGGGMSANVMVSGSMEPKVAVGSLLLYETVNPEALRRGDVISFAKPGSDRAVTTHRIVGIAHADGKPIFQTKGDNNPVADPWLIHYEAGQEPRRLAHAVPYVGHVVRAAQGPPVRIALLVLVLGWLYLSFLRVLARGATRHGAEATVVVPRRGGGKALGATRSAGVAASTVEATDTGGHHSAAGGLPPTRSDAAGPGRKARALARGTQLLHVPAGVAVDHSR